MKLSRKVAKEIGKDHIKQCLDSYEISYYNWYVDDITIKYNKYYMKDNKYYIPCGMYAKTKLQTQLWIKNTINYLDTTIFRKQINSDFGIYRNEMNTDTTIRSMSNYPKEKKKMPSVTTSTNLFLYL